MKLVIPIAIALSLVLPLESAADPLLIHVVGAQHSVAVSMNVNTWNGTEFVNTSESQATTSGNPVSDFVRFGGMDWARADADLFATRAMTDATDPTFASFGQSQAMAHTAIQFTP